MNIHDEAKRLNVKLFEMTDKEWEYYKNIYNVLYYGDNLDIKYTIEVCINMYQLRQAGYKEKK